MSRLNPELLRLAKRAMAKSAFVASGDPSMDPAAAAAGGGDPAAAGGPPPGDPAAAGGMPPGGGGGDPLAALMPTIQQLVQQAVMQQGGGMGGGGGMAGGAGGPIKPKIDINMEIMKIEKMLAKIMDAMGITMPVSDMVATSDDLTQMAAEQQQPGGGAPPGGGAIPPVGPIEPMKAAMWEQGQAFTPPASMHYAHATAPDQLAAKAQALLMQHLARRGG